MSDTTAHLFDGRAVTLLAGIRADGADFSAFPSPCSGVSVASDEAEYKPKTLACIRPFYRCGGSAG